MIVASRSDRCSASSIAKYQSPNSTDLLSLEAGPSIRPSYLTAGPKCDRSRLLQNVMHKGSSSATASLNELTAGLEAIGVRIAEERRTLLDRVVVGDLRRTTALVKPPPQRNETSGSRDSRVFRFGQVVELKGSLTMSDAAYTGAHFAGLIMMRWSQEAADNILNRDKHGCVDWIDLLQEIMRDPVKLNYLTDLGNSVRYKALYDKYSAGVQAFLQSKQGRNPAAAWRQESPTTAQNHMLRQLGDLIATDDADFASPKIITRGQAFDFIALHGGNPRYRDKPELPSALRADTSHAVTRPKLEPDQ